MEFIEFHRFLISHIYQLPGPPPGGGVSTYPPAENISHGEREEPPSPPPVVVVVVVVVVVTHHSSGPRRPRPGRPISVECHSTENRPPKETRGGGPGPAGGAAHSSGPGEGVVNVLCIWKAF